MSPTMGDAESVVEGWSEKSTLTPHPNAPWVHSTTVSASSLGSTLREAREIRGLSIADVAQTIKFSVRQIEAIERDDFGSLPGTTIVRGFIRSYARLLRLDPEAVLAIFDRQVPPVAVTVGVLTNTGETLPRPSHGTQYVSSRMPLVIAFLTLATVTYFYWPVGLTAIQTMVHTQVPVASKSEVGTPVIVPTANDTAGAPPLSSLSSTPERNFGVGDSLTVASEAAQEIQQAAVTGVHQLIFVFDDKSWVEVKDATNRVILAQNNLPGTRQVVSGKPPFAIVVGNASRVQLLYEERQIDLQPHTKVDVARLTLE